MPEKDTLSQTPEQNARDIINRQLTTAGWAIQKKSTINWHFSAGIAVTHYPMKDGTEADYVLFVDRKPVGIIEAKREEEGHHLSAVEAQSSGYAGSKLKHLNNNPLPFVYESTGVLTHFTDYRDPKPRSRSVFTFHRPETLREWLGKEQSLRGRMQQMAELDPQGLRECQTIAINNLEQSFRDARPRALVQMATGSGKTFTAITSIYRLLKHADAKRVLFLVDTRNLGEQAEQEFRAYTPNDDNRTFGFFNENIVSEYSHKRAVADGVNVGYSVYLIETEITNNGAELKAKEFVDKREKLSRRKRWEQLEEDVTYTPTQLDRDVVNPSQIRNIIRAFREILPLLFPGRTDVPKTLVFAKTDSHAEDIIRIIREEFNEGNDFCKKITCKADEDPKSLLARFRNEYNPRIAVTVDMIATGTDVKPLECELFMRDVKSNNYFEQMKGRGTRTLGFDDLKKVTPSVTSAKTHFVIVDAVGITRSLKTDSRPLERKPTVSLKELLEAVTFGAQEEDLFISLASRLARLDRQITEEERATFIAKTGGKSINQVVRELLESWNPDTINQKAEEIHGRTIEEDADNPSVETMQLREEAQQRLLHEARSTFNGSLNDFHRQRSPRPRADY